MATQRAPFFVPATPLGEAERELANSLDSLLKSPLQSNREVASFLASDQEFLSILRAGEVCDLSPQAIVWGINLLREQLGVLPRLDVAKMQFSCESEQTEFLIDSIQSDLRRQRLLAFLSGTEPAWKDEDHPDIVAVGSAAWVHNLRREKSARFADRDEYLDPL